jgi:uncharacterized protein
MKILGRRYEQDLFNKLFNKSNAEFVVVYGRRRVGKTYLIRNAFESKLTFQLTGIANANMQQQLANFHVSMLKQGAGLLQPAVDWFAAFQQLGSFIEQRAEEKKVIFLDELPWLDTATSGFIPALEHFWNSWASNRTDVLLIVCGSAASWMINKLINAKGGLHNRVTARIKLEPFTLAECEDFFKNKQGVCDRYQLVQLYMAMGGIPFYLNQVDVSLSAAQNINRLCFSPTGLLQNEFKNLYASLFKKADKYIAIIEALAGKLKGITRDELLAAAKLTNGGSTTRMLKELEESSFIRSYKPFEKKERHTLYQLSDFYSLFYIRFIKNHNVQDEDFWLNSIDSPQQRVWSGYAFEQVCLSHLPAIKKGLGISGVLTKSASWIGGGTKARAQIDLLIDRRDQVINLCEMKFSINKFEITKRYADEIKNKITAFKEATGTRKAIYFTMITSFGLQKNNYSALLVQNELTMDALFD